MHTAFENLMIHVHLQIAITIALRCVLHRRGNRGIPCQNFCFFKDFRHRHTIGWSKKKFFYRYLRHKDTDEGCDKKPAFYSTVF